MTRAPIKLLLDLRPALDQHGGIPQAARLLFRGLGQLDGIEVTGLLQSSTRVLARGLPTREGRLSRDRQINRSSRVVISLQSGGESTRVDRLIGGIGQALAPARSVLTALFGVRQSLAKFEPAPFKDFVWRHMFARTLPSTDYEQVTGANYRVARLPWKALHLGGLATRKLGHAIYPRMDTTGFDVMIAETPYPGRVVPGTKLVVRYHDAVPMLMPHTISNKVHHQAAHFNALRRNVRDGAWFACVSESTRRDLIAIFPEAESRAVTIPNVVSHHYFAEQSKAERVADILRIRHHTGVPSGPIVIRGAAPLPFLLMVSTIEPRKNHLTLLSAWEQLRAEGHGDLQLVFVGMLGWDHKGIVKKFQPWLARGGLHLLEDVPSEELRLLYRHAKITVCPSFGEGFDYSGVEAMRCGGIVAASDIAVHKEIFGEAAEYFSAYSTTDLVGALKRLLSAEGENRRQVLTKSGAEIAERYTPESVLPIWGAFLLSLQAHNGDL